MYVRRNIRTKHVLVESWPTLLFVVAWSVAVVYVHEIVEFTWIAMPVLPVTLIGIAVSLYLGFKNVSAYNRWWEARGALGTISVASREWAMQVQSLIYGDKELVSPNVARELIYRHLGWLYAVAHMLRKNSRLKISSNTRIFAHRRIGDPNATMHEDPKSYGQFLNPEEFAAAQTFRNPPAYLIRKQAERVRELARSGYLDTVRQDALNRVLERLDHGHGTCERIKNTPFPRQIGYFGTVFTWIFVILLPLAFLDVFEVEAERHKFSTILTHEFVFTLVPFAALISWVFLMMEKIGDSSEDPFEGGVHDVPLSTVWRTIEIDLKQALGEPDIPPPLAPVDEVLY